MSIPEFDVALEVSKLRSLPAIPAISASGQIENSKKRKNSSSHLRIVPNAATKTSRNSKNSGPSPSVAQDVSASIPAGLDLMNSGLEWVAWPADVADPDFDARWAAYDLADLCRLYGVRVVRAEKRILMLYPVLEPDLVAYTLELLVEARSYLLRHMNCLPILTPAEAVASIKGIMRQYKGLRFCRGEDGSWWPLYPTDWTVEQKATVQALWFAAGEALDNDSFMEVD